MQVSLKETKQQKFKRKFGKTVNKIIKGISNISFATPKKKQFRIEQPGTPIGETCSEPDLREARLKSRTSDQYVTFIQTLHSGSNRIFFKQFCTQER